MATNVFQVQGMTCDHCERAITNSIEEHDLNAKVRIDRANGKVEVSSTLPRESLISLITEEGYTVAP